MVFSTVSGFWGLSAVQAAEGYVIQVSVDKTEVTPGETVSMTVKVTKDGEEIKDLEKAGLETLVVDGCLGRWPYEWLK